MSKNIDIDNLAKEIKREIALEFRDKVPAIFENIKDSNTSDSRKLADMIFESINLSMDLSEKFTTTLIKRVLEKEKKAKFF